MNPTREQEVVRLQAGSRDPCLHRLAGRRRDLELHRTLCLLLQNDRPCSDSIAVAQVAHAQLHQVAGAQFAVDTQVEECEVPQPSLHLQADPNGPDLSELERHLLADELTLVPRLVALSKMSRFHDGLLSVEGRPKLRRTWAVTSFPKRNAHRTASR